MVRLVTARLVLREAEPDDAPGLAAYQTDPRYLEHYPEAPDAERIVATARQWATESPRRNYQLMIEAAEATIGCAGLRQIGHPPGEAEVGVELHPDHWGRGYAREVLSALIEFARDEVGVARLCAMTTPTNERAHRLMQHLGFVPAPSHGEEVRFELALR